jgi:nitrate/nitrite transporter NarK
MSSPDVPPKAWSVLLASTWAFTACFMVWMMFAAIGIPLRKELGLNQAQFGLLASMPVLSGSLIRVPLGIWTDKYGGRVVMAILLAISAPATWCIAYATEYWQFLVIGLLMGLAGGSFSVGTPYVARWFPSRLKGTAMGVFGGYVGLSLWLLQYYQGEYGLDLRVAGLLTACFALPGGAVRAMGGVLSDKFGAHRVTWWVMWVCWICLFILSYPQTDFTITTAEGPKTFHIGLNVYAFTALLFILGIAMAFGKASVFKYIGDEYTHNIGAVSGAVGLAGGLGGFILPIMFGALMDFTGIRSSAFMLLYGVVWVSLIWMYWTEVRTVDVVGQNKSAAASQAA